MSVVEKCGKRVPLEERDTYQFATQTLSYMLVECGIEKKKCSTVVLDPLISESVESVAKAAFVLSYFSRIDIGDEFTKCHPNFSEDDFILFVLDTINSEFDDHVFAYALDAMSIIFTLTRLKYNQIRYDMLRLGANCFAELMVHKEADFDAKGGWKCLREVSAIYENAFDEFLRPVVLTDDPIEWQDVLLTIDSLGDYDKLKDIQSILDLISDNQGPLDVVRFKTFIPFLKAFAKIQYFKCEKPLALNSYYLSIIMPKYIFPELRQTEGTDHLCSKD